MILYVHIMIFTFSLLKIKTTISLKLQKFSHANTIKVYL